jgi:hypothetical protein
MMLRRMGITWLVIGFTLILAGCTGGSSAHRIARAVSWQEIHAAVGRHRDQIVRIAGNGRISLESPDIAQSGSFLLAAQKPDSVMLRIEGPFGIRVGSILLTRDSIKFYSALENRLYLGSSRPANLQRIFRVGVSLDDLMSLLSGGAFMREDSREPDSLTTDEDQFVLWYSSGGLSRRYWVDGTTLLLRRVQFLDARGHLQLEHVFTEFRTTDGIETPFMLRTIRPKERQMLSLRYYDLTLNPRQADLTFAVPASAEQIWWKE